MKLQILQRKHQFFCRIYNKNLIKMIDNLQTTAWKNDQEGSDKIGTFSINENLLCRFSLVSSNPTFRIDSWGLSRGVYCSIIYVYPTPPTYVLHSAQRQFIGFQGFTLLLCSKRVSYFSISDSSFSQMFGPKYDMPSKALRTVSFLFILKFALYYNCSFPLKRINH